MVHLLGLWLAVPGLSFAAAPAETLREWPADPGSSRSAGASQLYRERSAGEPPLLPRFDPPNSLAPLIRAVRPGVVNIHSEAASHGESEPVRQSLGSGFIISPDGYVVTNDHVVDKAAQIQIKLADGREFPGEVVGRDPSTDLALLRLTGLGKTELPFNYLGDSDKLQVGDWVVAIGNPFGLDHSVSHGLISAKERVIGVGVFDDFVQTDALINPGNSGGPLFNMLGEVVGVNTAIVTQGAGIGFAVPINMVKDLLPNLRVNGRLARGWLGVNIKESPIGEGGRRFAVVVDVFPGSPAAKGGLRAGDRVNSVNGRPVETYLQLLRKVALLAPGSRARFSVQRGTEPAREVAVTLGQRPSPESSQTVPSSGRIERLGLLLKERAAGVGLEVVGVTPHGPAEQAGILAGDLIVEFNRKPARDLATFNQALELEGAEQTALLRFNRGEHSRYVALKLLPSVSTVR